MFSNVLRLRFAIVIVLISAFWSNPLPIAAQDLVAVSSLTGSSSVFVFRSQARNVRRSAPAQRPTRTKSQRLESVTKIKRQYDTLARITPKANREKVVDPNKLPPNARTLPPAQASKLFSGVAEYYIQNKQYDRAIEIFLDAVNLDGTNVSAKTGLSEALALKGTDMLVSDQTEAAKGVFLEALKYDPKNAAAYFGLGEVYAELDQFADAIASYERSLESDTNLTEIYVPLGILYFQTGEIAKADDMLSRAVASSEGSAQTQYFVGMVRSSQNRNEEAAAAFQKAKTIDPQYADAFFSSAEALVRLKRPLDAIPDYKRAIELKPNYFDAYFSLGEAYFDVGNYPEAIIAYKAAAKLKNDKWEVFYGLAESQRQAEEFTDAQANYNLAALFLTRNPDFNKETAADIYSKAGYVIGRQCPINMQKFFACQWPSAVKALEKAVELGGNTLDNANLGWAYYNAARMDLDARRPNDAMPKLELAKTNLQKALVDNPSIADGVLQNLGAVQIDMGDFAGAVESLKQVVDKQPTWTFTQYALGTAYFKLNDFANAAKYFQLVIDQEPRNVGALASLGYSEIKRKNKKEVRRIIDVLRTLSIADANRMEQAARVEKLL